MIRVLTMSFLFATAAHALQLNDSIQQARQECPQLKFVASAMDEVKATCPGLETEFGVRNATLTFDLNGTLTGLACASSPEETPASLRSALEAKYGPPRDETYYQTRWVTPDQVLILELADYNGGRTLKALTRKRPSALRSVFVGSCTTCDSSHEEEVAKALAARIGAPAGTLTSQVPAPREDAREGTLTEEAVTSGATSEKFWDSNVQRWRLSAGQAGGGQFTTAPGADNN